MTKRALILATETYGDGRFAALPGAASDAEQLSGVLGDPEVGGFEVGVLFDETAREWKKAVQRFFASAAFGDTLLLHLSCHGRKDGKNRLHFVTQDSEYDALAATSVSAEFVADCMETSHSQRIILLLDCCFSGAFTKGMRTRGDQEVELGGTFEGRGRVVITSSTALEYSHESTHTTDLASRADGEPSVFTSAVVHGLRTGEADLDGDGVVTADDLYRFISRWVPEQVPDQTPTLSVDSAEGGRFELARNPRAAENALSRALAGAQLPQPVHELALAEAGRRTQESEARAAELGEQVEKARAEAARYKGARSQSARELSRMLGVLFGIVGGAIGLWTATLWVDGFTLPGGGGTFLALAISAGVLNASFVAVAAATVGLAALAGAFLGEWLEEEKPFARDSPTGRKVLAGLLIGGAVALLLAVLAADAFWLLPLVLDLGSWICGLAGLSVSLPSGWGAVLAGLSAFVGLLAGAAAATPRGPRDEIREESGPGYYRRVHYRRIWGPFRETYTETRGGEFGDFHDF